MQPNPFNFRDIAACIVSRGLSTSWSYARDCADRYDLVTPGRILRRRAPRSAAPLLHWKFRMWLQERTAETFVCSFHDGRVCGRSGSIVTADDRLVWDLSRVFRVRHWRENPAFLQMRFPVRRVAGRVAVVGTAGARVYYHWMCDVLPRFQILSQVHPLDSIDWFVLEYDGFPFQKETLAALGISENRIIRTRERSHISARELIVPSLSSRLDSVAPAACDYLRTRFGAAPNPALPRNLYLSRQSNATGRRVLNAAEVEACLERRGFAKVMLDRMTVRGQAELFAGARRIVAPHGSALTNTLFCPAGARILDIFAPEWVNPCFWTIAEHLGLDYGYVIGLGRDYPEGFEPDGNSADVIAPIEQLEALLEDDGHCIEKPRSTGQGSATGDSTQPIANGGASAENVDVNRPASPPMVAVVIPAFNAERTIERTLKSACAQTYRHLEILVVDDGSSDRTALIVEQFATEDDRIKLIRTPNRGVACARNEGIRAARADYVAMLDADDLWHPTKIEKQMEVMLAGAVPPGFVYCHYRIIDAEDHVKYSSSAVACRGNVLARHVMVNFAGNGSSLLLRRAAIEAAGGYDPGLRARGLEGCEDLLLQLRIASIFNIDFVPEYLVGYRQHPLMMSADQARMLASRLAVMEFVREFAPHVPRCVYRWGVAQQLFQTALSSARRGRWGEAAMLLALTAANDPRTAFSMIRATLRKKRPPTVRFVECSPIEDIVLPSGLQRIRLHRLKKIDTVHKDMPVGPS